MQTPPMTGPGIPWISWLNLPIKDNRMANTAAPPMTQTL